MGKFNKINKEYCILTGSSNPQSCIVMLHTYFCVMERSGFVYSFFFLSNNFRILVRGTCSFFCYFSLLIYIYILLFLAY